MKIKIPLCRQFEPVECGAASLKMVLGHFGHCAPLGEVREACAVSRDGSSVFKIYKAAESYGLKAKARKLARSRIEGLSSPAILHWEMNHFVVYAGTSGSRYLIADPAVGLREVTADEFDLAYTGVALTFETADHFLRRTPEPAAFRQTIKVAREFTRKLPAFLLILAMMTILGLAAPLLLRAVADGVVDNDQLGWLQLMLLGFLAIAGIYFLLGWSRNLMLARIQEQLGESITGPMVHHLLSLPLSFFRKHYTADLLARADSIHRLRFLLSAQIVAYLFDGMVCVSYFVLMLVFNLPLTLIVVFAVMLYAGALVMIQRALQTRSVSRILESTKHSTQLVQTVKGALPIKASGGEPAALNRWLHQFIEELTATDSESQIQDQVEIASKVLLLVVPAVTLLVGLKFVLDDAMSLGTLLAFQMLLLGLLVSAGRLVQTIIDYGSLSGGLERLDDVLMTSPERCGEIKAPLLRGQIEIRDLSFYFDPAGAPTIDHLSFSIPQGSKVALVGPSGSGKSTLVQLLMGLYQPKSGKILFDDQDLAELDYPSLRRQIGVVPQEPDILMGTVQENISLYDPEASLEKVAAAARAAQIDEDIQRLPQGYQTVIHHDSELLSGGQRQRLALARAILHSPPILILDEATSAVDTITESAIAAYLESRACTQIVVAHRLSTVRNADQIYVLNQGTIVEQGRHEDLAASGGLYQHLFNSGHPEGAPGGVREGLPVTGGDLESFSCLRHLSPAEKAGLAQYLEVREFSAGTTLIDQGAPPAGLFLLASGQLHANFVKPGIDTWTLAEINTGAVVGEVSLVDGSPASATVVTTEPSVLYYLTVEQFMNLRRNRDVLAGHLLSVAAAASASRVYDCYRLVGRDLVGSTGTPVTALGNPETGRQAIAIKDPAELLGSTLAKDSIARLESIGTYRDLESDEALYVTGQDTDHIALVVGGALAVISPDNGQILDVLTPGKWAGVIDYFGGAVTRGDVVSTEASRVLMFDRVRVEDLVSGGDESGFQLLELLAGAVVATLRRANIAAQEARARHDSELESELQQRAQDLAASRGQVLQPLQHQNQTTLPAVPFVGAHDVDSTLAACLTAVLLAHGHSDVTESRVRPQIGDDDAQLEAVGEILRRYGLLLRPLATSPNDLRYLEHPLFVLLGTSTFVVGQQWRRKGLEVMDPVMGHRTLSQQCLQTEFHGSAFEIRPQVSRELGYQSLWSRVKEYFGKHRKGLVGMSGATVLFEVCRLSIPLATVLAIDFILPFEDWSLFVITALGLSGALLIALLLEGFRLNSLRYLRAKLGLSLLEQLVSRILRLPILTLQQMRPAVLMQRFRSLDQLRKQFDNRCIYGLLDAITLAVSVAVLAFLNPVVALVVGITSLSLLTFLALNQPRLHRLAESTQREELQNSERLSELLESIQTTRSCGDPDNGFNRWCPGFRRFIRAEGRQHRAVATLESITDAVQVGLIGVVLCLGAMAVVLGTLSLGVLIAVVLVTLTAASGLNGVTQSMMTLSLARPQVTKLNKVLELQTESDEHKQSVQILRGGIELDAVDFRYLDDAPRVLTDISFKVEPGSKIAIVGASGSGKSTLGKLLMGLYMPNSGRTLIDGYDISVLDLPGLRRQIGAVLQSTQLMSGTIRSNIAGNRPDCDLQTVMEAADIAAIHDLIETLPMKYDTVLAEGGGGLSVGQRQRISIARALVHQPKLLLLDEATSALDNQSQQRVESRLRRLGLTRIVIAHRLSTVLDADQILVLDQGRIKERGRHEELMARKDLYYHLIQSQAV